MKMPLAMFQKMSAYKVPPYDTKEGAYARLSYLGEEFAECARTGDPDLAKELAVRMLFHLAQASELSGWDLSELVGESFLAHARRDCAERILAHMK